MSMLEWYNKREILLTGVTSQLGSNFLEKLLRSFSDVKVHTVVRSSNGLRQTDRVKKRLYDSPGYERLRQERPTAMDRVEVYEGNLVQDDLGLTRQDAQAMINVTLVFHAAGPSAKLLEYCRKLPNLQAVVLAGDIFSCSKSQILECLMDEELPRELPICLVRLPALGPALRDPMPGFVQILTGATALIVGAGHMLGRGDLPAEIIPVDIATNTLIAAAWNYGKINKFNGISVCNASTINCSWAELIKKGDRANPIFRYPTFRVRGITSSAWLHWIIVFLFEWLPSVFCDTILYMFARKERITAEHLRIRELLQSFEPVVSRKLTVQRRKIIDIQKVLKAEDQEFFPLRPEIDVEAYVICAAAATRRYCVNESNLTLVQFFMPTLIAITLFCFTFYYYFML